jgi:mono/diheme cytochrome c family protein
LFGNLLEISGVVSRLSCNQTVRMAARSFSLFIPLVLLVGCADEYPPDLSYPLRNDVIVSATLKTVPPSFDRPGEFPDRILDPNALRQVKESKTEGLKLAPHLFDPAVLLNEGNILFDPANLKSSIRTKLEKELDSLFGTPLHPKVGGIEDDVRKKLGLDEETLAEGSARYRLHCLHCHGLTGNGRGPTAPWVNPHPRDYRQGLFKFMSTSAEKLGSRRKPRRDDLLRTLREGIEGTSMPTFALLPEEQLNAVASYVIHLSIRGELEYALMLECLKTPDKDESELKDLMEAILPEFANRWVSSAADDALVRPDPKAVLPAGDKRSESIRRGWELFKSTKDAGCIGCHKDYGRQSDYFYDDWGTIGRAADLTTGVYRGGRRPIDFYWRIHSGVGPAHMPAFYNLLKPEEIWDVVNFLQVLPHRKMREELGIQID